MLDFVKTIPSTGRSNKRKFKFNQVLERYFARKSKRRTVPAQFVFCFIWVPWTTKKTSCFREFSHRFFLYSTFSYWCMLNSFIYSNTATNYSPCCLVEHIEEDLRNG